VKWPRKNSLGVEQVFIGLAGRFFLTARIDAINISHVEAMSDACRDGGDQDRRDESVLHFDEWCL
jgi:hypothetical protein